MARLKDFGKLDRTATSKHVEDVLGLELTITKGTFKTGNHGEYVVFTAIDEDGEEHEIISGAKYVLDALHDAADQGALPVQVEFYKEGNTVMLA